MTPLRQQFIDRLKLKGRSANTIRNYVASVIAIAKHFRISPLLLKKEQIDSYCLFLLNEKKRAPATVNLFINAMKIFFKLMAPGNTVMSGFSKVKMPRHLPVVLSREEVERVIAAVANLKQKAAIMLLYSSGLRLHECVTLRLPHIESARMKVRVEQGKGKKDRYTLLSQRTLQTLRDYCRVYKPKEWLFEGQRGGHYSTRSIDQIVRAAVRKSGIKKKITPHTFRHSFATHLMETGVALPVIQKLLGHSSIKTTMIYLHVTEPMVDRIRSPFDEDMAAGVKYA
jgi:integrase/recombinase XerD